MYCLLEILAVAKDKLAPQFVKHIDWIKVTQYLPALYIETNLEGPASQRVGNLRKSGEFHFGRSKSGITPGKYKKNIKKLWICGPVLKVQFSFAKIT